MNKETLKKYEPFFGGYFICDETDRTEEYSAYRVIKHFPDGRTQYAVLRCYSFECEKSASGAFIYPAKLRRLVADTETMIMLQSCPGIVKFYAKSVLQTESGYEFFILLQDVSPLYYVHDFYNVPKADAYEIASAVCNAISSFRSLSVTHKKICPENIFVDDSGEYLLGDFGIGTTYIPNEDYLTPEEYKGASDLSAVDVYQTGILLYKLLNNNRAPFLPVYPLDITDENKQNAFMRRMNGETVGAFEGSLPYEEKILSKACAYSPSARYRNISTFKSDIDALIDLLVPSGTYNEPETEYDIADKIITIQPEPDYTEDEENEIKYPLAVTLQDLGKSDKLIKALIISISLIIVIGAILLALNMTNKNSDTPTTETTTTTAPSSTELTTASAIPSEILTQISTEPTTAITTVPTSQVLPMETTVITTTTPPTTEETKPTVPETQYIDVDTDKADITVYKDNGKIDEIVISINTSFGAYVTSKSSAVICEYCAGELINTYDTEVDCMYDSSEDDAVTICDIHPTENFVPDTDNCTYEIVFDKGAITGFGYANNSFTVEIDSELL